MGLLASDGDDSQLPGVQEGQHVGFIEDEYPEQYDSSVENKLQEDSLREGQGGDDDQVIYISDDGNILSREVGPDSTTRSKRDEGLHHIRVMRGDADHHVRVMRDGPHHVRVMRADGDHHVRVMRDGAHHVRVMTGDADHHV